MADIENAPDDRRMDLAAIAGMTFFLIDTDGTESFLLDAIRLGAGEPACPGDP